MEIIIANTNVGAILKTGKRIMEKYGTDVVPEKIKGQATLSVIKSLSTGGHFSVCKVNKLMEMNGVTPSREHGEFFDSLHCVDWKDIHEDTREYLFGLLVHYFKGNIAMANSEIKHD